MALSGLGWTTAETEATEACALPDVVAAPELPEAALPDVVVVSELCGLGLFPQLAHEAATNSAATRTADARSTGSW